MTPDTAGLGGTDSTGRADPPHPALRPEEVRIPMLAPAAVCAQPAQRHGKDEIHLYAFRLADTPASMRGWLASLSPGERTRAARFVQPHHRDRYVIAHGVLREVLARHVDVAPGRLAFEQEPGGKPRLAAAHRSDVTFNLSHSDDCALLAIARHRAIGVDLERIRPDIDPLAIASRFFFGAERAWLEGLPSAARQGAFFRLWVAKEAVLKGDGIGLELPLDRFAVRCDLHERSVSVETHDPDRLAPDWRVAMLPLAPGWCGAVAARGIGWRVVPALGVPVPAP